MAKTRTYKPQAFDHLAGLDGISDAQIAEHRELYAGYVKQVNALNEALAEPRARQAGGHRSRVRGADATARVRVQRHDPA